MNSTTSPAEAADRPLTIDIVSDVVCPWCYIGKRRLEAALAGSGRPAPRVRWHPFQLNPDLPAGGVDRRAYLEAKFGGPDRAQEAYARVQAAARDVGLALDLDRIARQPNTLAAHRLIAWAQAIGPEAGERVVERLFAAYFTEGADIGAAETLARLAGEAGCDPAAAAAHLGSSEGSEEVVAADERMRSLGIGGVPFFIFNRRLAVSGAQPPEILRDAMAQAEMTT